MSMDRRIGLETAIPQGTGTLSNSDGHAAGRQASDADRQAFEQAMAQGEPEADGPVVVAGPATAAAVALGATATVVLGVIPQPVLDLAGHATTHMFVR